MTNDKHKWEMLSIIGIALSLVGGCAVSSHMQVKIREIKYREKLLDYNYTLKRLECPPIDEHLEQAIKEEVNAR